MPKITFNPDPFKNHLEETYLAPGETIRGWVEKQFPGTKEFPTTTICLLNGKPLLRKDWGLPLYPGDDVCFISNPNLETLLYIVVSLVIGAIAAYALTPTPRVPGGIGEPDPVYSITGQSNQNRLGSEIEDPYGLNRLWPSKASREYTSYSNNQQEIFMLLCLGQGYYDTATAVVQIEDTAIANFADIEYEFYAPGEAVTLFPDNVDISGETSDLTLYAPNEVEFTDWLGPFTTNDAGTQTNKIEVDLVFPSGLYYMGSNGKFRARTVTATVEYREIDDAGVAVGAGTWSTLVAFTKSLGTNTPQRFTDSVAVTLGRYEVRAKRTSNIDTGDDLPRLQSTLKWVGLRAFIPSSKDYGNVTLLAVKARASNNLNGNSSNRVNVITTRKLPTWDGSTWSAPAVTRSVVWAFCNILRADYNLNLADDYIDLTTLAALNTEFEAAGIYFDHIFDRKGPVWEKLETIARAANAIPIPLGSQISMVVDEEKTVPKGVFTKENILAGSLSVDYRLFTDDEFDGVEIEYEDPTTYQKEVVSCLVGNDAGTNLEQIKLPGVKDRTRAWRIGMRIRETRKLRRSVIKFTTGAEGEIPNFNDLILVCHDVIDEGSQSGRVLSIVTTATESTVTTDTELDWTGAEARKLAFRTALGEELGPFTVTQGASPEVAVIGTPLTAGQSALLQSGANMEKTIFAFGTATEYARKCRVASINISGGEEVEIEAAEDNPTIYSHDAESPPAATSSSNPAKIPDLPTVTGVFVRDIASLAAMSQASWNAALGAQYYIVQIRSKDPASGTFGEWSTIAETSDTFHKFTVNDGEYSVRVAAVNVGQGPWGTVWTGNLGQPFETSGGAIQQIAESQKTTIQTRQWLEENGFY